MEGGGGQRMAAGETEKMSGSRLGGRAILAESVFAQYLPVAKYNQVNHVRFDARTIGDSAGERRFHYALIVLHPDLRIAPLRIGNGQPRGLECLAHRCNAFVARAIDLRSSYGLEYAFIVHEGHKTQIGRASCRERGCQYVKNT